MALAPASRARLHATAAALGTSILWWRFGGLVTTSLFALATVLALLAWFSPRHYYPVQRQFDRLTHALLAAVSWTALGVVYFGIFTPLRFWRVLTRKDPLALRRQAAGSYFQTVPPTAPRFDRQF